MSKITKYSFFVTVFGVSFIWFGITLMILMFHEDNVSSRIIREHERKLELEGFRKNTELGLPKQNPVKSLKPNPSNNVAKLDSKQLRIKEHKEKIKKIKSEFEMKQAQIPAKQVESELRFPPKLNPAVVNKSEKKSFLGVELKQQTNERKVENMYAPAGSEWERLKHLDVIAPEDAPGKSPLQYGCKRFIVILFMQW